MNDPIRRFREEANRKLEDVTMDERLKGRILAACAQPTPRARARWLPTLIVTAAAMIVVGTCMSLLSSNIVRVRPDPAGNPGALMARSAGEAMGTSAPAQDANADTGEGESTAMLQQAAPESAQEDGAANGGGAASGASGAQASGGLGATLRSTTPKSAPQDDQGVPIDAQTLSVASLADRYGYIDETGAWVIEPAYDVAFEFGGHASAVVGKLDEDGVMCYALIDGNGAQLTGFDYLRIEAFTDEWANAIRLDGTACALNALGVEYGEDGMFDGATDAVVATATPAATPGMKEKK